MEGLVSSNNFSVCTTFREKLSGHKLPLNHRNKRRPKGPSIYYVSTFWDFFGHTSHCLGMSYYVNFLGGLGSNEFHIK